MVCALHTSRQPWRAHQQDASTSHQLWPLSCPVSGGARQPFSRIGRTFARSTAEHHPVANAQPPQAKPTGQTHRPNPQAKPTGQTHRPNPFGQTLHAVLRIQRSLSHAGTFLASSCKGPNPSLLRLCIHLHRNLSWPQHMTRKWGKRRPSPRHFPYPAPTEQTPGVPSRFQNLDIVVIRENTEGEYSGLEHETVEGVVESLKVRRHARACARTHARMCTMLARAPSMHVHNAARMQATAHTHVCPHVHHAYTCVVLAHIQMPHTPRITGAYLRAAHMHVFIMRLRICIQYSAGCACVYGSFQALVVSGFLHAGGTVRMQAQHTRKHVTHASTGHMQACCTCKHGAHASTAHMQAWCTCEHAANV
eukprot:359185-Chlamydomonas_euryale.AAC.4